MYIIPLPNLVHLYIDTSGQVKNRILYDWPPHKFKYYQLNQEHPCLHFTSGTAERLCEIIKQNMSCQLSLSGWKTILAPTQACQTMLTDFFRYSVCSRVPKIPQIWRSTRLLHFMCYKLPKDSTCLSCRSLSCNPFFKGLFFSPQSLAISLQGLITYASSTLQKTVEKTTLILSLHINITCPILSLPLHSQVNVPHTWLLVL